jgi:hypothetical protein
MELGHLLIRLFENVGEFKHLEMTAMNKIDSRDEMHKNKVMPLRSGDTCYIWRLYASSL